MKEKIRLFMAVIIVFFGFSDVCYANELSDLKMQLDTMQKQIQEQTKAMQLMQKKIATLETTRETKAATPIKRLTALDFELNDSTKLHIDALARSYYVNDQRINWSGQESTFGVEGALGTWVEINNDWGRMKAGGDFFFNQPFGKNILHHGDITDSYRSNFEIDPFVIDQLSLEVEKWNLTFKMGKTQTPFGRYYFPLFVNSRFDGPFIRTEAILWRETGIFMNYKSGFLVFDIGLINGESDMDTNSAKGLIGRLGFEGENWAVGISAKALNRVGSGDQKQYKNHAGADFMVRFDPSLTLSGEIIYDQFGFVKDYSISAIDWPRSLYYRDVFYKKDTPIEGVGGYLNLGYQEGEWLVDLNYGEYHSENIDKSYVDTPNRRGIIKLAYDPNFIPGLRIFTFALIENTQKNPEVEKPKRQDQHGLASIVGMEYKF